MSQNGSGTNQTGQSHHMLSLTKLYKLIKRLCAPQWNFMTDLKTVSHWLHVIAPPMFYVHKASLWHHHCSVQNIITSWTSLSDHWTNSGVEYITSQFITTSWTFKWTSSARGLSPINPNASPSRITLVPSYNANHSPSFLPVFSFSPLLAKENFHQTTNLGGWIHYRFFQMTKPSAPLRWPTCTNIPEPAESNDSFELVSPWIGKAHCVSKNAGDIAIFKQNKPLSPHQRVYIWNNTVKNHCRITPWNNSQGNYLWNGTLK